MNNIDRKKTTERYNEAVGQPLLAGFSILVIILAFGVIFFINPAYEVKKVAYACGNPTETPSPISFNSLGDAPTDDEWTNLGTWFPNALRNEIRIMDRSSNHTNYNCASWSIKRSTSAIWSESLSTLQYVADNYYGFDSCSASDPDCSLIIMDDPSTPADWDHVMNRWEGEGPLWNKRAKFSDGEDVWESKLGSGRRIIHRRNALSGSTINYGTPIVTYKRQ